MKKLMSIIILLVVFAYVKCGYEEIENSKSLSIKKCKKIQSSIKSSIKPLNVKAFNEEECVTNFKNMYTSIEKQYDECCKIKIYDTCYDEYLISKNFTIYASDLKTQGLDFDFMLGDYENCVMKRCKGKYNIKEWFEKIKILDEKFRNGEYDKIMSQKQCYSDCFDDYIIYSLSFDICSEEFKLADKTCKKDYNSLKNFLTEHEKTNYKFDLMKFN